VAKTTVSAIKYKQINDLAYTNHGKFRKEKTQRFSSSKILVQGSLDFCFWHLADVTSTA
jgi:hypothetical protein